MPPRASRRRGALPTWPRQRSVAKRTSGTLTVLLIGDSIGDGVGADPTGTGVDELAYGGATPPAGCTLHDTNDGTTWTLQATYPDSAGAAPENPGLVPHIHARALALGYTGCAVRRYAVSGATTPTVRGFWEAAWPSLLSLGITPDVVVVVSGTNDANNSTQSAAFNVNCPLLAAEIEWLFGARVVWVEMVAGTGIRAEADVVRGSTRTHMALRTTRRAVNGAGGLGTTDSVHPDLTTYQIQGREVMSDYQEAS